MLPQIGLLLLLEPLLIPLAIAGVFSFGVSRLWRSAGGEWEGYAMSLPAHRGVPQTPFIAKVFIYLIKFGIGFMTLVMSLAPSVLAFLTSASTAMLSLGLAVGGFFLFAVILPLAKKGKKHRPANTTLIWLAIAGIVIGGAGSAYLVHRAQSTNSLPSSSQGKKIQKVLKSPFK